MLFLLETIQLLGHHPEAPEAFKYNEFDFYWVINKAQNEYKVHFSILSFFRVSVGFLVLEASCITLTMICMIRDDVKTCHSWPHGHSWQVLTSSLIMQIMVSLIEGLKPLGIQHSHLKKLRIEKIGNYL